MEFAEASFGIRKWHCRRRFRMKNTLPLRQDTNYFAAERKDSKLLRKQLREKCFSSARAARLQQHVSCQESTLQEVPDVYFVSFSDSQHGCCWHFVRFMWNGTETITKCHNMTALRAFPWNVIKFTWPSPRAFSGKRIILESTVDGWLMETWQRTQVNDLSKR